jgi:hypothetical protein
MIMGEKSVFRKWCSTAIGTARSLHYHDCHKKEAMKAILVIETYNSQKLTPALRKIADEYSREIFGSRRYAPWLYVYTLVSGQFKEGWIPDNFFGKVVCPRVNKELVAVTGFKTFSNVVLRSDALPDIGYYIDGNFYNKQFSLISPLKLREQICNANEVVSLKKDRSGRADGNSNVLEIA